jgi:hypothetical protein
MRHRYDDWSLKSLDFRICIFFYVPAYSPGAYRPTRSSGTIKALSWLYIGHSSDVPMLSLTNGVKDIFYHQQLPERRTESDRAEGIL